MTQDAERNTVVILGASHAGVAVAAELRSIGFDGQVVLVGSEDSAPYHRPHLSKDSLEDEMPEPKALRPEEFYRDKRIERRCGTRAVSIDRFRKALVLADGAELRFNKLILATGARARALPATLPGSNRALTLRQRTDWVRLAAEIARARTLTVIGGGLIGLEVAAAARARGLEVNVVEAAPRLMSRTLYPPLAEEAARQHREAGISIHLGTTVEAIDEAVVRLRDGTVASGEIVLAAIGSEPRDSLAAAAGLATCEGIVVDHAGATSDPAIFALGDCAQWSDGTGGLRRRHESVAATQWQARCVAAALTGAPLPPSTPLRLWSYQGALRFQMSGPVTSTAECRLTAVQGGLLLHAVEDGKVIAVQSLNAPRAFNAEIAKLGQPEAMLDGTSEPVLEP